MTKYARPDLQQRLARLTADFRETLKRTEPKYVWPIATVDELAEVFTGEYRRGDLASAQSYVKRSGGHVIDLSEEFSL